MINNSLRDELDAEIKDGERRKHLVVITIIAIVLGVSIGAVTWGQSYSNSQRLSEIPTDRLSDDTTINEQSVSHETPEPTPKTTNPSTVQQTPASQPYTPSSSINKAMFVSDGQSIVATYNQIVGLVTFTSTMTDGQKTSQIKQAVSLDSQSFGKTTSLRSQLVIANVTNGPYMDATELAESGVSKISVGLTFMNYWADDHSRSNELQSGLGSVTAGSTMLQGFSSKLNQL